MHEIYELIDNH